MLDIRTYDIAVTERIKQYFKNTHFIMRQSLPIQEIRDRKLLNGEDVEFPIILVRRTNCPIFSKEYNWCKIILNRAADVVNIRAQNYVARKSGMRGLLL